MSAYDGYLIALGLVAGYAAVVIYLRRSGRVGADRAFSMFGPALMIKTRRGRGMLERLGRFRRLWSVVGDVGIALAALAMVTIVGLLVLEAVLVTQVPASAAPSPQTALGLPGINPIIPIGYGIVALIVGVVLHELFHGIIARSQKIGVKSLGILWCVIPIGAFVEQDDVEMNAAPRRNRDRVVAAGVLANFGLTLVFFAAASAILTTSVAPNAHGAGVAGVLGGYPAANASLSAGDILVQVNGTATPDAAAVFHALEATKAGQTIPIEYYSHSRGTQLTTTVTLASAAQFTQLPADKTRGFLGVSVAPLSPSQLTGVLAAPWSVPGGPVVGFAEWIILPFWGLQPVSGPTTLYYHTTGALAFADVGAVWISVNLLYWLSWMNLLLGLSNALPIYPFDGGLLFRDFSGAILARWRSGWDNARRERVAIQATTAASLLLVFLIAWLFVGPRL